MQLFPNAAVQMGAGALRSLKLPSNEADPGSKGPGWGWRGCVFKFNLPKDFVAHFVLGNECKALAVYLVAISHLDFLKTFLVSN